MKNFLTALPKWAKGALIIFVIVVIIFSYKEIKKYNDNKNALKDNRVVINDVIKEIDMETKKGATLTYPQSAYDAAANTIQNLLDGCETFSSEINSIKEIIKCVKIKLDWLNLIKTFDVREISNCGSFGMSKANYDLLSLCKDQLDSSGVYSLDVNGYSASGACFNSLSVLNDFLTSKKIDNI